MLLVSFTDRPAHRGSGDETSMLHIYTRGAESQPRRAFRSRSRDSCMLEATLSIWLHLHLAVEGVPEKPHQYPASYKLPKRTVSCSFQHPWLSQWPFLHYSEANDVAFDRHTMSCRGRFLNKVQIQLLLVNFVVQASLPQY